MIGGGPIGRSPWGAEPIGRRPTVRPPKGGERECEAVARKIFSQLIAMAVRRQKLTRRKLHKKRNYNKKKAAPKRLRKMIKRTVQRMAEKKQVDLYQAGRLLTQNGNPNWPIYNCFPVSPYVGYLTIQQGVSQSGRIGNKVAVSSLTIKGVIYASEYDIGANPTPKPKYVKLWLYSSKVSPVVIEVPDSSWFQLGGTTQGFTNSLTDMFAETNTDRWTVHKTRIFKVGFASYSGGGGTSASEFNANNDFKLSCPFSFNCTKMIPHIMTFDDNNASPTSRLLMCAIQPVNADGTTPSGAFPLQMSYTNVIKFTDI